MKVKLTDRYNCIAAYVGSSRFSGLTTVGAGAAVDDDASAILYIDIRCIDRVGG